MCVYTPRFLEYNVMGFVLAVFPMKYGFITVQDAMYYGCQHSLAMCGYNRPRYIYVWISNDAFHHVCILLISLRSMLFLACDFLVIRTS